MEERKKIFHAIFNSVDFRKVKPVEYKLFQVADLICSLELLNLKGISNFLVHIEILKKLL